MSDAWGPAASPPPPPGARQSDPGAYQSSTSTGSSGAFRDTLILAVLGVVGVVGMIVWSGGDLPAGAETESGSDFTLPPDFTLPDVGSQSADAGAQLSLPQDAAAAAATVSARDALIAVLPTPAGGAEQAQGAGVRSWLFTGSDWETLRDDYLGVLRSQRYVATLYQTVNASGTVGELYVLSDPSGTINVRLAVATTNGQSTIAVSRQ